MLKKIRSAIICLYRFTGILRYVKSKGFKLQKWQTRYVLTGDKSMLGVLNDCRATYKTFSVIARAFLLNPSTAENLVSILRDDPDFCRIRLKQSFEWYYYQYVEFCYELHKLGYRTNSIYRLDFMICYNRIPINLRWD